MVPSRKLLQPSWRAVSIALNHSNFSTSIPNNKSYKVVVVGGGAGGCATAAKLSSKLGAGNVAVIEPSSMHYYQPMWTLVGGGMKTLEASGRPMGDVLPKKAEWIKQKVTSFDPSNNCVITEDGQDIHYEYLVVALGIQINYDVVKGLPEAFETPGVCSNYSPLYVNKTFEAVKNFKKGNAIFSFPATPVKCAGAPQKVMYISEDYWRRNGKIKDANIIYNTSLPVIFGVKHYADALWKVVEKRNINVNLRQNLVEVKPDTKEAIFQNLDKPEELTAYTYEMLHVTPPMSAPDALKKCSELSDAAGFLNVNKETLQHVDFPNVFGIGDCTNAPCAKTAAAVAAQTGILRRTMASVMGGKKPTTQYEGYTSCPLVTGANSCIMAEFDYNLQPLETFPIDQAKERRTMFHMKKDIMPHLYFSLMLRGFWEGPKIFRNILHLGMK